MVVLSADEDGSPVPAPFDDRRRPNNVRAIKPLLPTALIVGAAVVFSSPLASAAGRPPARTTARSISTAPTRIVSGVVGGGCVAFKAGDQCAATASIFPSAPRNVSEAT